MAALLAKIGFNVTHKSDLGFIELRKTLQDFGKEADGPSSLLFTSQVMA